MKKAGVFLSFLIVTVILGGCAMSAGSDKSVESVESAGTAKSAEPVEWGKITNFSMNWGDFHGGRWSFIIEERDGQYLLNTSVSNGVQMSMPEDQPIPAYEVEAIRWILEENGVDEWNGFDESDHSTTGDFSFRITVNMDTGSTIAAYGMMRTPKGFDEAFPPLRTHLLDMAERYKIEPEWGNLKYMSFAGSTDTYRVELKDSAVHFRRSPRFHGDEPLLGVFESDVLEELHQIMKEHGIAQWWDERHVSQKRESNHFERRIRIEVGFDNDTDFSANGFAAQDAVNALIEFFEELTSQTERAI